MTLAYIGLGSNIGDREENLRQAIGSLGETEGIEVRKESGLYETEPVGFINQPAFLNAVVEVETGLSARELLAATKAIEKRQKRERGPRWGPRTIDLDILLYDESVISEDGLTLPHPEASSRAFVLVPLVEIAPEVEIPPVGKAKELLDGLGEIKGVEVFKARRP